LSSEADAYTHLEAGLEPPDDAALRLDHVYGWPRQLEFLMEGREMVPDLREPPGICLLPSGIGIPRDLRAGRLEEIKTAGTAGSIREKDGRCAIPRDGEAQLVELGVDYWPKIHGSGPGIGRARPG
jgi:hypothetical protein